MKYLFALVVTVFFLAVGCLVFSSCKVAAPAATVKERTDSTTVKKDSTWTETITEYDTIYLPGDSVMIVAWIECDSITNKAKDFEIKVDGKNLQLVLSLKNGMLNALSKYDSSKHIIAKQKELIHTLSETITKLNHEKEEVKIVTEYKTHWYDIAARWLAVIFIILIIIKLTRLL